jgi:uncharacterized UBP type Zn finger protein
VPRVGASVTGVVACTHIPAETAAARSERCEECGSDNRLRLCATCGHVGCCESQRGDGRAHALGEKHPVIKSLPLGQRSFTWCYDCNDYV